jgi:hypothetical protein
MTTTDILSILMSNAEKISFSGAGLAKAVQQIFEMMEQEKRKEEQNEER